MILLLLTYLLAPTIGEEEELDFYDFFLGFSGNKRLVVNPEDPVAVVVAEEGEEGEGGFERTVQHICRDIYRERIGGLPFPEDLSIENEKEIERRLTENRISVVEEDLSTFLSEGFQVGIKEIEKEEILTVRKLDLEFSTSGRYGDGNAGSRARDATSEEVNILLWLAKRINNGK
ncbi:hypothetical protein AKJ65_07735 [candidate division MSBL1 archaeon SCGC-AAA259E19]|uniref:Uncharacterized protein n=1 Tax=candidate division MSBL1 archaeon SCGC-AAA259E19 TaxID=1698264 RepID=A0A133UDT3_9EURY|nr:hypothetical protein AKJ65_07735 [candidate division MSBL1 archaeon SCGC-AAA259E19]